MLQIDGELELLRDVVRIDLERELRLPQRALEVTQTREREAEIVVRLGVPRTRLNRSRERVLRVLVLFQIGEDETDAVPRYRLLGHYRQRLTIGLESFLQALSLVQEQREVEPRFDKRRLRLERGT